MIAVIKATHCVILGACILDFTNHNLIGVAHDGDFVVEFVLLPLLGQVRVNIAIA